MITIPFIKIPGFLAAKKMNRKTSSVHDVGSSFRVKTASESEENSRREYRHNPNSEKKEEEAGNHIHEITETVRTVNMLLENKNAYYRFNVRQLFDEYFIEMIFLDEFDNVIESKKRNITHEEFNELVKHIETGEGIFFEGTV